MILIYILFEKLHRYVFDNCFNQSTKANNYTKLYFFLDKYLFRFRYKLTLYFPKKYKRYNIDLRQIGAYEIDRYYNLIDKIVYNYRIKNRI
jgi:hypothetical protein